MSTIFALGSAPGKSGIAILRISGPEAGKVLLNLGFQKLPVPRAAVLKKLISPTTNDAIDDAIVLWFPAPASFTGEDIVELHLHGSRAVIKDMAQILSTFEGLRHAEPGEFSRRAFENGKMDLTAMEGLADLIDAETKLQQKQALRQISGELENLYEQWREELITILAHTEAYIDFPEEDIPDDIAQDIEKKVATLHKEIQAHLNDGRGKILREGLYIAIIGAPNVGKSTLMNLLAKRDIAIVSSIAGTTRDVLEVHMDIGGYPVTLVDTAGLRKQQHADEIETIGIKRALKKAETADMKICVFDGTNWPDTDNITANLVDDSSIVIINKSDLASIPNNVKIKDRDVLAISALTGKGANQVIKAIETLLSDYLTPLNDPVFTRERHRDSLRKCTEYLECFASGRKSKVNLEISSEELRLSARELGKITGQIETEDVLDQIFSSFCIGK